MTQVLDAGTLREMLEVRYQAPEWHLEHEVTHGMRRLDSVAFRLWGGSGKGHLLLGFELKVSRADWRRELQQFDKGADWAAVVDEFYIVAPKDLVPLDELPRGWGLLEVRGSRLYVRAHPSRPAQTPDEMPRLVAARFVERLRTAVIRQRHEIQREIEPAIRAALEAQRAQREDRERTALAEQAEQWDALVRALEALGVGRYAEPARVVHQAAALVRAFERMPAEWEFDRISKQALTVAERFAAAAPAWREATAQWQHLMAQARAEMGGAA